MAFPPHSQRVHTMSSLPTALTAVPAREPEMDNLGGGGGGRASREALASRPRAIYINTLTSGHLAICINTSTVRTFISRVKTSVQAACLQHAAKRSRREAGEPVGRCGRGGWLTRLRRGAVVFSRSQARLFELPTSLLLDKSSSYRN